MVRDAAQCADRRPVNFDRLRRESRSGRRIHERHELVREPGHRATDADAADVRASTDAGHPASLGNVAIDDGSPTTDLYQALGLTILFCKDAFFVIAGAIATVMDGRAEEQFGTQF